MEEDSREGNSRGQSELGAAGEVGKRQDNSGDLWLQPYVLLSTKGIKVIGVFVVSTIAEVEDTMSIGRIIWHAQNVLSTTSALTDMMTSIPEVLKGIGHYVMWK
ncbi:uncharacterized protein LOC121369235 [Gigantopelta aegis]|uniref:uncharacterized protein LOC121369235 n=1 Tax=Gigantopelta aegis TaxID=1735272 RepID=UPI001B88C5FB|nr:uncharacterized protein LOC121369235 [Gigantopelta aegis]